MIIHSHRVLVLFFLASVLSYTDAFSFVNGSGVSICQLGSKEGNLFGFSLAAHILPDDSKVLLVGAPKAMIGSSREGTVYSCKLEDNLVCTCAQLDVGKHNGTLSASASDPQIIPGESFVYNTVDDFNQAKNGSLMGFSVTSNDEAGHAAACAPLHLLDNLPFGSCVGLAQDLNETMFRAYLSYGDKGIFASGSSVKIRKETEDTFRIIAGAPLTNRDTAGFSIGSVDQIHYTNTSFDFGGRLSGLAGNVNELKIGSISSYVGYAVDYGYFSVPGDTAIEKDVIASAPRYNNHKGAIIAFSESTSGTLSPTVIASGDTIGSYYGYSMLVVNFDPSDGCDDLIVGSPLQTTFAPLSPDRGQITVYKGINNGGVCELFYVDSLKGEPYDRLGGSITDLGDINRDGVPDIAVGGLNTPNIYVYLGTPSAELVFAQYIDTSQYGFTGIYALHGGVDFNGDGYADIAFSDPTIEKVKVLAGSPLVRIEAVFEVFTEDGELVPVDGMFDVTNPTCESTIEGAGIQVLCFQVRACFNLTSVQQGQINVFSIDYFIDLDLGRNDTQRVYFIDQGKQSRVEDRIELQVNKRICSPRNFTAYFVSNFGDISPVSLTLDVHSSPPELQNIISNDTMFSTIIPTLDISPELLYQQGYAMRDLLLEHPCSDGVCNVDLALEFLPLTQLNISEDIFTISIKVTNNEDDVALQTYFTALFPENIEVVQRQVNDTNELSGDSCSQTSRHQICTLQPNPFMSTKGLDPVLITYRLKFTFDFQLDLTAVTFRFNISSPKSIDVNPANNEILPVINLNASSDLFFQVKSSNDRVTLQEMDDGSYAGVDFQVTFRVGNRGPSWLPSESMRVVIFWPLCIRGYCSVNFDPEDSIDILINSISYITQSFICENPRRLNETLPPPPSDNSSTFNSFQLCNQTAICLPIVCTVQLLRANSNTYISIASSFTLGSEVRIPNSLLFEPTGYLKIPEIPKVTLGTLNTADISQKIYIFPEATLEQCILIFPIIAGVVAGIAVIIVIGIIIWLIQFTKRERYIVVKRRTKETGSRPITPSTTGQLRPSDSAGIETSQV
ncbi:Integrin alpha [Oopsacas minuta]|uniref:Integrin alpha n=1 Tax=Oopsacas minuta TaxID=111878 RepID=A0AAV7JMJ2_9METZ|nr:Integrin alpha [Oopsacas minuta]